MSDSEAMSATMASVLKLADGGGDANELVDVTRHNFASVTPLLSEALSECDFLAFDCEMTGLFLENNGNSFIDDMPDRYKKMYQSAQSFAINQFGMSMFSLKEGRYVAKTFNFNLFPRSFQGIDKRFTCQASSLEYLANHNFDFNKMIYDGIPYLTLQQSARLLAEVDKDQSRNPFVATSEADIALVANIRAAVGDWLQGTDKTLCLGAGWTSAQRALCYSTLREMAQEQPGWMGYFAETMGEWPATYLQLTRATKEEHEAHLQKVRQAKKDAIKAATGFSSVMEMIRQSKKPVVGHNMLFDVIYTLNMFMGDFPEWPSFRGAVTQWFPAGLYDTKYISKVLNEQQPGLLQGTSLGSLYESLLSQDPEAPHNLFIQEAAASTPLRPCALPEVQHAPGFTRYAAAEGCQYAHEAGFDAFMTGVCFVKLLALKAALREKMRAEEEKQALEAGRDDIEMRWLDASPPLDPQTSSSDSQRAPTDDAAVLPVNLQKFGLSALRDEKSKINMMRSDMPYCGPYTPDQPLTRDNMLVVAADPATLPSFKEVRTVLQACAVENVRLERFLSTPSYDALALIFNFDIEKHRASISEVHTALGLACTQAKVLSWADFALYKRTRAEEAKAGARGAFAGGQPSRSVAAAAAIDIGSNKRPRLDRPSWTPRANCSIM